jgi:Flp pilus assembly protein TadG
VRTGSLYDGTTRVRPDRRGRVCANRGQTLVEFALASVVFFVLLFGIIEFGLAVWQYNMVADLAQEGARWALVRGSNSDSPASTLDVQTFVQSRALGMAVTVTTPDGAPSTKQPGDRVSVNVVTTFTPLAGLLPRTTLNLQSTARMIMAR